MDKAIEKMLETASSFKDARIFLSGVELNVFTAIGEGKSSVEVAWKLGLDERGTETLLNALVAIGFLKKNGANYLNTEITKTYLDDNSPQSLRKAFLHYVNMWNRWNALSECVKTGKFVVPADFNSNDEIKTEAFIAAMHLNSSFAIQDILETLDLDGVKKLLDVGGGSGAYSIAFAKHNPQLRAEILDLEAVCKIADRHIEQAGLKDRVKTVVGNYHTADYGSGFDMVFMSSILHINSPDENLAILRKSYDCLNVGGKVVIKDNILDADKTSPKNAALFSVNMLVATNGGSSYSETDMRNWLTAAGFKDAMRIPLKAGIRELIIAKK